MSDIWTDDELKLAKQKYFEPRTVNEMIKWLNDVGKDYDLIQEASSARPLNYREIDHPLDLESFTFKKIANLKTVDLTNISTKILKELSNITVYNSTIADWRKNSVEQQFLIEKGFDRETHSVKVTEENYPEIYNIGKYFDFDFFSVALQYQPPGGVQPRHVDFLQSMLTQFKDNNLDVLDLPFDPYTKNPIGYYAHRCMIALTDWQPGQIFGFENTCWMEWKRGDVIVFDWAHARHYTANASFSPRLYLKVSGITKNKNHWIFNNLNTNTISDI